jgi:hypothetical protein
MQLELIGNTKLSNTRALALNQIQYAFLPVVFTRIQFVIIFHNSFYLYYYYLDSRIFINISHSEGEIKGFFQTLLSRHRK